MYQAMLDRAGIPYDTLDNTAATMAVSELYLAGSASVLTGELPWGGAEWHHPHPGGYRGMFVEHIFTADGALWAVWVWE
jgi:hypothetical protein